MITISLIIVYGIWETVLGWEQLIGLKLSHHYLFPVTGSFYNPGPYCLFLGIIIPLAFNNIIKCKRGIFYWEGLIYFILAISLMPILLGRTGWIAALIGLTTTYIGIKQIKLSSKKIILSAVCCLPLLIILAFLLYQMKPASASGRLFIWIIGFSAMLSNPISGVGPNNVGGALGVAQEQYFRQHPQSMFAQVAGSPEYAFNEYLQIGIAFGIPVLTLFVVVLSYAIYSSWKGKEYGLTGALMALAVGCVGSYPFRFMEFIILAAVISIGAVFSYNQGKKMFFLNIILCLVILSACIMSLKELRLNEYLDKEWEIKKYAYKYSLSEGNIIYLDSLMEIQKYNPKFLFDYGKALRDSKRYGKSNEVLLKGVQISSDPMFLNLIGRNFQDLGNPAKAAEYYTRSVNRLPGRLYPYYLLCKLYSDSLYFSKEKFLEAYNKAIEMEPKVMSPAFDEMRNELIQIYERINDYDR